MQHSGDEVKLVLIFVRVVALYVNGIEIGNGVVPQNVIFSQCIKGLLIFLLYTQKEEWGT